MGGRGHLGRGASISLPRLSRNPITCFAICCLPAHINVCFSPPPRNGLNFLKCLKSGERGGPCFLLEIIQLDSRSDADHPWEPWEGWLAGWRQLHQLQGICFTFVTFASCTHHHCTRLDYQAPAPSPRSKTYKQCGVKKRIPTCAFTKGVSVSEKPLGQQSFPKGYYFFLI